MRRLKADQSSLNTEVTRVRPTGGGLKPRGPSRARSPTDALTRIDDNDTRAYLDVEERVLTAAQRPRAQEIASQYREALDGPAIPPEADNRR